MKCTTCDEELAPGTLFCPNCGSRVTDSSAGAQTIAMSAPYGGASSPPQSGGQYGGQPYAQPPSQYSSTPQSYAQPPVVSQYSSPPQPYAPPQQFSAVASAPNSTAATVSLVFGILAWTILPIVSAIVAVVAGHMGRNEIRASGGQLGGGGLATAGLILGYLQLAILLVGCMGVVLVGLIAAAGS